VATEVERVNELIRSALRAVVAVSRIEGIMQNAKFAQMMDGLLSKDHIRALHSSITQGDC
jgi:hypothetical protein